MSTYTKLRNIYCNILYTFYIHFIRARFLRARQLDKIINYYRDIKKQLISKLSIINITL